MNRNVESHFSQLPSAHISRSRFDRSQDVKFTFDASNCVPFFCDEVLPGDTFDITTSKVVRMPTLIAPIFSNIYLDTYWFFVPNRLVWSHWRELMGENTQSAWIPQVEYSVPQIKFDNEPVEIGDCLDYMGVPVGVTSSDGGSFSVSALPLRAYSLVMNEFFRSENLTDPINVQTGDADVQYEDISEDIRKPFKAAKYFDVFTSCLPSPQKGPPVSVPAGFNAGAIDPTTGVFMKSGWPVTPLGITNSEGSNYLETLPGVSTGIGDVFTSPLVWRFVNTGNPVTAGPENSNRGQTGYFSTSTTSTLGLYGPASNPIYPSNLFARPASNDSSGLSINVNDLRYAFQLQKLYERDARGGTRYQELLFSHFSVTNPDARLQRPEYLGGNRIGISIHQIANQSQGEQAFLGDLGAMSLTTDKHHDFVKSFTEHGILLGICVARYDHSYPQGLEKFWSRKNRFDYYWPVFANLGEEAVKKKEIFAQGTTEDEETFGYQERWYDYRYKPDRVAAYMRPGVSGTLDSWHLADYYTQAPTLSDEWIREDKTNIDRVIAVTSAVTHQFFADIYVKNYTTRPMPLYSIPGLIDHH